MNPYYDHSQIACNLCSNVPNEPSIEDAVWSLRLELTERRETLENRARRAPDNSHAWHQLQGQLLELDRIIYRLSELPA